jgi:DNA replication protein DnaC
MALPMCGRSRGAAETSQTWESTVFGNPGSGKTHLLQAVGQELVRRGHRMLFITCEMLVQELLIAKRDLKLSRLIKLQPLALFGDGQPCSQTT